MLLHIISVWYTVHIATCWLFEIYDLSAGLSVSHGFIYALEKQQTWTECCGVVHIGKAMRCSLIFVNHCLKCSLKINKGRKFQKDYVYFSRILVAKSIKKIKN